MSGGPNRKRKATMLARRAQQGHDRLRCRYCAIALSRKVPLHEVVVINDEPVARFTLDHVIPRCEGGRLTWENTEPACEQCNTLKGNKPLDQFIAELGDRAAMTVEQARNRMCRARGELPTLGQAHER